jgi:N-acetylmuramoyl-L-alanine amidase
MAILSRIRVRHIRSLPAAAGIVSLAAGLALAFAAGTAVQGQAGYTLYSPEGKRTVALRAEGPPETLALEPLAPVFGLTFTEDRRASGLVIGTRGQRIIAVPGQSFVQVAGKVVTLDAPIRRERNVWTASLDILPKVLGPAIGQPVVIRRASRLILVGDVAVPQVGGRVEKTASGARVVLTISPPAPHRITRDGNRLTVRFDAVALDATPLTGFIPEFATAARVDGPSIVIDLGPSTATYRADDNPADATLSIDLLPTAPAPEAPARPAAPAAPPAMDLDTALRTIVIDAGHGGDDIGAKSEGGAEEKTIALQLARRLKAAIEARLGLRVLLTRDSDENVAVDRRTALANNNKADLFVSLHANASVRPAARGAQVLSLDATAYQAPLQPQAGVRSRNVPVLGGGMRVIEPMPWDLAQLPFADQSAAFAAALVRQLTERGVPLHSRPAITAPLRTLAGANMPAVLVEVAFLTNDADAQALASAEFQNAIVDALVTVMTEMRRGIPGAGGARGGH